MVNQNRLSVIGGVTLESQVVEHCKALKVRRLAGVCDSRPLFLPLRTRKNEQILYGDDRIQSHGVTNDNPLSIRARSDDVCGPG
jgi:hypothetical protein